MDNDEVVGTGNDARLALYEQIASQNDDYRKDEFVDIVDLDKGITEPFTVQAADGTQAPLSDEDTQAVQNQITEGTEAAATQDDLAAAVAAEQQEAAATGQAPVVPTMVVNGKTVVVTPELIAELQKVGSANEYLRQAAEMRNNVVKQAQQAKEVKPEQADDLVALARAIQMGTEEEAVAALQKIRSSSPSTDDLTTLVKTQVQEAVVFEKAVDQYRRDYADIIADPILHKLAIQKDQELLQAGDARTYSERWADIGNELRSWKTKLAGTQAPAGTQQADAAPKVAVSQTKQEKKAGASGTPQAAGASTQSSVKEEKEPTPSEIIAAMAKQRGAGQSIVAYGG